MVAFKIHYVPPLLGPFKGTVARIVPRLTRLKQIIQTCNLCPLMEKPPVPPEGNLVSPYLFVARNPGRVEHLNGRPLIGPGGKLFDLGLESIGWEREAVFIHNTCLCYTLKDRPPHHHEIVNCRRYLSAIISIVNPKVIIPMGRRALENVITVIESPRSKQFIELPGSFKTYRAKQRICGNYVVFPVTHPGQALRQGRSMLFDDFKMLSDLIQSL